MSILSDIEREIRHFLISILELIFGCEHRPFYDKKFCGWYCSKCGKQIAYQVRTYRRRRKRKHKTRRKKRR